MGKKKKIQELYWEAAGCFDRGNRLESDADTIEQYLKIRCLLTIM